MEENACSREVLADRLDATAHREEKREGTDNRIVRAEEKRDKTREDKSVERRRVKPCRLPEVVTDDGDASTEDKDKKFPSPKIVKGEESVVNQTTIPESDTKISSRVRKPVATDCETNCYVDKHQDEQEDTSSSAKPFPNGSSASAPSCPSTFESDSVIGAKPDDVRSEDYGVHGSDATLSSDDVPFPEDQVAIADENGFLASLFLPRPGAYAICDRDASYTLEVGVWNRTEQPQHICPMEQECEAFMSDLNLQRIQQKMVPRAQPVEGGEIVLDGRLLPHHRAKRLCAVVVTLMITTGLVASIIVIISQRGASSHDERLRILIQRFENITGKNGTSWCLSNESPGASCLALRWLAKGDRLQIPLDDAFDMGSLVERYVLFILYLSTDGHHWDYNANWLTEGSQCQWYGVICSNSSGPVSKLHLGGNRLMGNLPMELSMLANLEEINLQENSIEGPIPLELMNLTRLAKLDLSQNQFDTIIPTEIGFLTSLMRVNLTSFAKKSQHFQGAIPSEMGQLKKLVVLSIEHNDLAGTIPFELFGLTQLKILSMSDNEIQHALPTELGLLTGLRVLRLDDNDFTGTLPPELGNLTQLEHLSLSLNKFQGVLPTEFGKLTSLNSLDLHQFWNKLEGTIPKEWGYLTNLKVLALYCNTLTGALPPELGKLVKLESLWLHNNFLQGPIPEAYADLNHLTSLRLEGNPQLRGTMDELFCTANRTRWRTLQADCHELNCSCCTACYDRRRDCPL